MIDSTGTDLLLEDEIALHQGFIDAALNVEVSALCLE
jgi:hypothetical protein